MNPPVTTILGIDASLRRTGIAAWRDGRLSTQTVTTDDNQCIEDRIRHICAHLFPMITRRTFAVVEIPFVSGNAETSMALAGLHFIIRYGLRARGVEFGTVMNQHLKQFATGNGRADKPAMVAMAAATFGNNLAMGAWTPFWPVDQVDMVNDEADALWCMALGLHYTGVSAAPGGAMEPGIDHQADAVRRKITRNWPELEWE